MNKNTDDKEKQKELNNKNRTYYSARNVGFGLFNKMITIILSFVSRTIFIHVLSIDYLGINGLFADVLTMLSLADLGFGTAMSYSFYKPLAENDEKRLAALITFYKKIYNFIALAVAVIGLTLVPFIDAIVNVDTEIPHLKLYYLIGLANTVVSYLFAYKSSIINADQKNYIVVKYSVWIRVANTVTQTIVLYITHNYLCYLAINVVATIANNLLISYKADTTYPFIKNNVELSKEEKSGIFSNMKSVFLYKIATVVMSGTDNIIISIMVGTAAVGLYSNYYTITTNHLGSVTSILFGSLTASVGNLIVKEKHEKRFEVFKLMQMVSFLISGFFVVSLYFLADDFIVMWIGKEYVLNNVTLITILMNFYLLVTFQPLWSFREASGLYQKIKYMLVATAIVNLIGSILLGKYFGLPGILGATVIAKLSTYFWYEPSLLYKNFFERKVRGYYIGHLVNCLMIILCIIIVNGIMPSLAEITIINWLIKAVICGSVVCLVYGMCYFKTKEFKIIIAKVRTMLKMKD